MRYQYAYIGGNTLCEVWGHIGTEDRLLEWSVMHISEGNRCVRCEDTYVQKIFFSHYEFPEMKNKAWRGTGSNKNALWLLRLFWCFFWGGGAPQGSTVAWLSCSSTDSLAKERGRERELKNNCENSCQALVLSLLSLLVQKYKYS